MKKIVVIGKPQCQACDTMKAWLDAKGIGYQYINGMQSVVWMKRMQADGARAFPQVYVDDVHVGGIDALQVALATV